MSAYWRPGEPVSAAKLNESSAATGTASVTSPGTFDRSGKNWAMTAPNVDANEQFWVAVVEEVPVSLPTPGSSTTSQQFRTIYTYSWYECRFDVNTGFWVPSGRRGDALQDCVMNYDPTQRIPLSGDPVDSPFSDVPVVTQVIPVARDPVSGQLFFFS